MEGVLWWKSDEAQSEVVLEMEVSQQRPVLCTGVCAKCWSWHDNWMWVTECRTDSASSKHSKSRQLMRKWWRTEQSCVSEFSKPMPSGWEKGRPFPNQSIRLSIYWILTSSKHFIFFICSVSEGVATWLQRAALSSELPAVLMGFWPKKAPCWAWSWFLLVSAEGTILQPWGRCF